MAYELYEQFNGKLPEVILYPTGGGTGLVGMWKAFNEMQAMGLTGADRPRLVSVQAEGCAPVVKAFKENRDKTEAWVSPHTEAYGLRVPSPIGGFICLRALRETKGTAIAVEGVRNRPGAQDLARKTGLDICPEGGAAWVAYGELKRNGFLRPGERVVIFNTGPGSSTGSCPSQRAITTVARQLPITFTAVRPMSISSSTPRMSVMPSRASRSAIARRIGSRATPAARRRRLWRSASA